MENPDENMDLKAENANTVNIKIPRHRKKQKFNAIRQQIEFYFGDSNLSKDRFLKKLIDNDPYVPIEIFLTFNRMKTLTTSVKEIEKSLETSNFLELSEDKTKVRRVTVVQQKTDIDDYIIYVECLPPSADHDWIRNTFSVFGSIAYVSLPRYRRTKKIKEFAFIEFEQKASVGKAMAAFKEFRGVITTEKSPDELFSIVTYNREEEEEGRAMQGSDAEENDDHSEKPIANDKNESGDEEEPRKKRLKLDSESTENGQIEGDQSTKEVERADSEDITETEKSDDENGQENKDADEDSEGKHKNRRKRVRKKKGEVKKGTTSNSDAPQITDLRITTKQTWKRLRNQYLNLQRENIKLIKESLKAGRTKKQLPNKTPPPKAIKPTRNINFYGALADKKEEPEDEEPPNKNAKVNEILSKKPLFTYEPGLIVKIKLLEACVDIKSFKNEMRQYPQVKYIDIKEGAIEAFLRLDTSNAAETFAKDFSSAEHVCSVLLGKDEKSYWDKIKQDREDKLLKKVKIKPKEKFVNKILKQSIHIRFDDVDE